MDKSFEFMGLTLHCLAPVSVAVKGSCAGPLAPAMLCRAALGLQSPWGKALDSFMSYSALSRLLALK